MSLSLMDSLSIAEIIFRRVLQKKKYTLVGNTELSSQRFGDYLQQAVSRSPAKGVFLNHHTNITRWCVEGYGHNAISRSRQLSKYSLKHSQR